MDDDHLVFSSLLCVCLCVVIHLSGHSFQLTVVFWYYPALMYMNFTPVPSILILRFFPQMVIPFSCDILVFWHFCSDAYVLFMQPCGHWEMNQYVCFHFTEISQYTNCFQPLLWSLFLANPKLYSPALTLKVWEQQEVRTKRSWNRAVILQTTS